MVWTAHYLMMALAGWRVCHRRRASDVRLALGAWALQLALNLGWSFVFFGTRLIGAALARLLSLVPFDSLRA